MIINPYKKCMLCPRRCGADRTLFSVLTPGKASPAPVASVSETDEIPAKAGADDYANDIPARSPGFCGMPSKLYAARAGLHYYEEPFLSGTAGSGTVFFTGCSLKCIYCQNHKISYENAGFEISVRRLSEIFLEQQVCGANNINLVTGTHYTPDIAEALRMAKEKGLSVPVIWNSSAYELPETLSLLDGLVDIWLPDFKTLDPELSRKFLNAPDYPEIARRALDYMANHTSGEVYFEADPAGRALDVQNYTSKEADILMQKGIIVRHLVIPGHTEDSKNVLKYLHETYGDRIWISIMSQYTPPFEIHSEALPFPELNRSLTRREYDKAVDYAINLGIKKALIQDGKSASESFIPAFDGCGIL